jgi:porin
MRKTIIILFTSVLLASLALAQEKVSPFSFGASYIGDGVANLNGGITTGTTYLGMANISLGFDTEKASWWKGGEFSVNFGNTHGGEPTATLVGYFQGISNIEAGNHTYLYELWYKQNFGNVSFTVGLQDLNSKYAVTENGGLFINSSFGIHSTISDNIPSPIFPLTALGASVEWKINESFNWEVAIFDGRPEDFDVNPYNVNWKINKKDGFLAVSELQINKSLIKNLEGTYKFAGYYHEGFDDVDIKEHNYGFYFVGDQQLTKNLSVFSQLCITPQNLNGHNYYVGLGVVYKGLLKMRTDDKIGFALAHAGFNNGLANETALELTYQLQLNENIYIKPDLQYIINPAGTGATLPNALVGILRVGLEF